MNEIRDTSLHKKYQTKLIRSRGEKWPSMLDFGPFLCQQRKNRFLWKQRQLKSHTKP